ncbi:RICIN domain-containing protein [Adlercreutzia sp. ZJ304]|uniref:RICIN domain-containing protein n=1 Tax=Adlercreutzia sp. ZJ304 TaxID=2709791 RepID=UPI0013EDF772|nr:RICIN domain-containing protein [Adlercreutzia sp. ZJ304]
MKYPKHSDTAIREVTVWQKGIAIFLGLALVCSMVPVLSNTDAFAGNTVVADNTASTGSTDGELLVVYENEALEIDEDATPEQPEAKDTLENAGVKEQSEVIDAAGTKGAVSVVSLSDNTDTAEALEQIQNLPGVESVQPNYEYSLLTTTSDPYNTEDRSAAQNQYYLYESAVADAWDYAKADADVTVAVLDTGCNLKHEDLAGTVNANLAYDVTTDSPLASSGVANNGDAMGHGTLVTGVLAAQANNARGIAGASYNASVLPIKVFDENQICTTADIIAAYGYLKELIESGKVSNLKAINISLGYYASGANDTDEALHAAIVDLQSNYGVLTVAAGGNGDSSGKARTGALYPSDFSEVLSVTALDKDGKAASFADQNANKDISAPGVDILSTTNTGGYAKSTGSSMAAPIVTGTAALLWAVDPSLSCSQVTYALKGTTSEVSSDLEFGNGNSGALNALAALDSVVEEDLIVSDSAAESEAPEAPEEPAENDGSAELAPDADKNAVMGSSQQKPSEQEFAPEVLDATELETLNSDESKENSWRFDDGELLPPENMTTDNDANLSTFSIVNNGGHNMFNWFDSVGGKCPSNGASKGIDVSYHNGVINWTAVKNSGVNFAIIRCGYGQNFVSQDDDRWKQNVQGCVNAGIPFGVYLYSYADNTAKAKSEAEHVARCLKEVNTGSYFQLPIFYDMEDSTTANSNLSAIASTFFSTLKGKGYTNLGVYANKTWWESKLTSSTFNGIKRWVAQYNTWGNDYSKFDINNDIWQFTSAGSVPGISGKTDLSYTHMSGVPKANVTPASSAVLPNGTYTIVSTIAGSKVLDINGGSSSNGANVQIYSSNNTNAQKFTLTYSGGFYTIKNVGSGKVLDVAGGSTYCGANVQQYASNNTDAQKWRIDKNSNGTYTLVSKCSGMVIDIAGGSNSNGANVQQYFSNGSNAQRFKFTATTAAGSGSGSGSGNPSNTPPVENGTYVIVSALSSSKVIDISGGSRANSANAQLYQSNGTNAQKFTFTYSNGYYTIKNVGSGKVLDVSGAGKFNGANVQQYASNNTDAQKWHIDKNSDGTYTLVCKCSGKVLDIAGAGTANGTNAQQYSSNGTKAQKFTLKRV